MSAPKHLWEIDHAYYCNEGNFFARESCEAYYKRWSDFVEDKGGSDMDYNLLFRWDWQEFGDNGEVAAYNGDPNYRNGKLKLFWMGQRKGLYRWSIIEVCRADEPAVIEFLKPRLAYLMALWAPLSEAEPNPPAQQEPL